MFCENAVLTDVCEKVIYEDVIVEVDVPGYDSVEEGGQRDRDKRKVKALLE